MASFIGIDLSNAAKVVGAVGVLNSAFFRAGAAAVDANDYIVYNQATGRAVLRRGRQRSRSGIQFATLASVPSLTAGDFIVI